MCVCVYAEVWVSCGMFQLTLPRYGVHSVTVGLAEHTVKSLHKHMETWCLVVRPQTQTHANLINPL